MPYRDRAQRYYDRMQHYNPFAGLTPAPYGSSSGGGVGRSKSTHHHPFGAPTSVPPPPPPLPPRRSPSPQHAHHHPTARYSGPEPKPPLPSQKPLGVFPIYTQHENERLVKLSEKTFSWTGDDFVVRSAAGTPLFQVRGKKFSLRNRKEFLDASGTPLFALSKRLLALHSTFDALDATDESHVLFTIRKHFAVGRADLSLTFANRCGHNEEVEFKLKGDWFDRKADVTHNGVTVARVSRSFLDAKDIVLDKQTYYLTVAPGVDVAMMVALAVCLDETETDKNA